MDPSDWIALASVTGTAMTAILSIGVSTWMANRRLEHDEQLHEERLAHERAEAVRAKAAEAYSATDAFLRHVNINTIHSIASTFDAGTEPPRHTVQESMDSLGFVSALGWNEDVRKEAIELRARANRSTG